MTGADVLVLVLMVGFALAWGWVLVEAMRDHGERDWKR